MKRLLCFMCQVMTIFYFVSPALTADKVVIVPLLSSNSNSKPSCTAPDEVLSQGTCWKDRNLGATQVATSPTDPAAYGDLYQWGRLGDGHQNRTSSIETNNSVNDVSGHSSFITVGPSPFDWRIPQNDILWQGLGGVNNPCPQGFRLPTEAEWETERATWSSNDAAGAFASPLKLVVAGVRSHIDGTVTNAGINGYYWSSSIDGIKTRFIGFSSNIAGIYSNKRAYGFSVRCVKN